MKLSTATLLMLFSAALAFIIPKDQAPGVYRVYLDENGQEVHELVARATPETSPSEGAKAMDLHDRSAPPTAVDVAAAVTGRHVGNPLLTKRQRGPNDIIRCGCGWYMDPGDCDAVVENLKSQFGDHAAIPPRSAWYSIMGRSVVAFACNYKDDGYYNVNANGYARMLGFITQDCGSYVAGTYGVPGFVSAGYMRYNDGEDFCASAFGSSADSC